MRRKYLSSVECFRRAFCRCAYCHSVLFGNPCILSCAYFLCFDLPAFCFYSALRALPSYAFKLSILAVRTFGPRLFPHCHLLHCLTMQFLHVRSAGLLLAVISRTVRSAAMHPLYTRSVAFRQVLIRLYCHSAHVPLSIER